MTTQTIRTLGQYGYSSIKIIRRDELRIGDLVILKWIHPGGKSVSRLAVCLSEVNSGGRQGATFYLLSGGNRGSWHLTEYREIIFLSRGNK